MILVTGGAGYIGSHAVKLLLEKGYKVTVLDNLERGYLEAVETLQNKFGKENLNFVEADLRDGEKIKEIMAEIKPEGVLHFAALCLVNESMEKPELYFENNDLGTLNLLKAMQEAGINKLVFSSTCAVYGESQYLPVDENHPTHPSNPYGESKLIAESMIKWFGKLRGLNYIIFRYFNVAGASSDGLIGDSKKPSQLLVQCAVRGALGIEPFQLTCPKVGTKDGTPIRDYVNVEDLAEAHIMALEYLIKGGQSDLFNLGTGKGNSVLEIVNQVKEITGAEFPVTQGEARKGEYAEIYANNAKVKQVLGWKPKKSIKDGVGSLVKWYKNKPNGWKY
jgi:UDP-glucose 4-epimerase